MYFLSQSVYHERLPVFLIFYLWFSSHVKVAPEETEDGEEVVWDFDHASGMTAAAYAVRPEEKPASGFSDDYAKTCVW